MAHPVSPLLILASPAILCAQVGLHWEKPAPKPSQSSQTGQNPSALGQLESLTGKKVDRFKAGPPRPTPRPKQASRPTLNTNQQLGLSFAGSLLGGLFSAALQPAAESGPSAAELAAQEAERRAELQRQQAELQAWAQGYATRMTGLIAAQRQQRTAQGQESLEGLRASLSDGFDRGGDAAPGGGLASALADPPVVDLRHSRTLTPSLLRGPDAVPSLVREADGTRRTTAATSEDLLKRREALQARLKSMMAENGDLRTLGQRFYELEAELARIRAEALRLGSQGRDIQRDMDLWGWWLDGAVQRNLERGSSLLMEVIVPKGTKSGLQTLQKNPQLWNKTLASMAEYNEFCEFIGTVKDRYDGAGEALDWVKAKHSLFQHVDFLATRAELVTDKLEAVSLHYKVGKSILGSTVDLAGELDGWGVILQRQGDAALVLQKQKSVQLRLDAVVRDLQTSRTLIAAKLGVRPEDLIPPQPRPTGLGSVVPPL